MNTKHTQIRTSSSADASAAGLTEVTNDELDKVEGGTGQIKVVDYGGDFGGSIGGRSSTAPIVVGHKR